MDGYNKFALNLFGKFIIPHINFFSDLRSDLKKSGLKKTVEEYLSSTFLTITVLYVVEVLTISYIFALLGFNTLFSIFMATTLGLGISFLFLLIFLNYPKFLIRDKARSIDKSLPFAGIYLSTIASSRLPPHKTFEIFSKFEEFGEISAEAKRMVSDMKAFGMNIYDSIERAIQRTASNDFRELLWSISSTMRSGGDLSVYLREKSVTYLNAYRRRLTEFSRSLAIYLEIYLTAIVLGSIFFTILTSIMSGLGGLATPAIVFIQFFLIFLFIPLVSIAFIILIKNASPGGG